MTFFGRVDLNLDLKVALDLDLDLKVRGFARLCRRLHLHMITKEGI